MLFEPGLMGLPKGVWLLGIGAGVLILMKKQKEAEKFGSRNKSRISRSSLSSRNQNQREYWCPPWSPDGCRR